MPYKTKKDWFANLNFNYTSSYRQEACIFKEEEIKEETEKS
jgi:hypothetical protein